MYDLVINDGIIIDGTGAPAYTGSIGINGDRIVYIGTSRLRGRNTISAKGMVVAPGFIDVHTHSDTGFVLEGRAENKVFQGITTDIIGNCGISLFPSPAGDEHLELFEKYCSGLLNGTDRIKGTFSGINQYRNQLNKAGMTINCGVLVGHGTLRICAMGFDNRKPTHGEMAKMKELLERQLKGGALGMSLGLIYPPGSFSDTWEIMQLAEVIKKYDAVLTAHIRDEKDAVFEAVKEMIYIAETAGARVNISHLKLMGNSSRGKTKELLGMIDQAKGRGVAISCDQYPYSASSTTLTALVPSPAHEGGTLRMLERLKEQPEVLEPRIACLIDKRNGADSIKIAYTYGTRPQYEGRFLSELSRFMGLTPARAVMRILEETGGKTNAIYFSMSREDVEAILSREDIAVGSDGSFFGYNDEISAGLPHPRNFGTFPKAVRLSREIGKLGREKIIRKITGLPAEVFRLEGIGTLQAGNYADITVFAWDEFKDTATYENPFQKPVGIKHVIVSGSLILRDGEMTQNRPGRIVNRINRHQ